MTDAQIIEETLRYLSDKAYKMRVDGVKQQVPFYTLNVIISAGYRVRHWANSVLKEYIIKGYSVNYNRIY